MPSVEIRQITFDFATEIYKTHALFNAKTNKLFLNTYQQQLS